MADIIFPNEEPVGDIGVTSLPKNVNLSIWKGDKLRFTVVFKDENGNPVPMDTTTPEAVIRESFNSPTVYDLTCTVLAETNKIEIYLPSSLSKTIPAGDYIWNFQTTDADDDVTTHLAGDVVVWAEVDT